MNTRRFLWHVGMIGLILSLVLPAVAGASTHFIGTLTVTSTADSGPGTLRQAMLDAGRGDTITFDTTTFPPASPVTITLTSALPALTQGYVIIDGSMAGVIIDGSSTPTDTVGIDIASDGNTISGLQVLNFPAHGVRISGGAQQNVIGGDAPGAGNVLSGNGEAGAHIGGGNATHNQVVGNYIGTDAAGTAALPNAFGLIMGDGTSYNTIGGATAGARNVISGNTFHGIGTYGASDNQIAGNYIGVDVTGLVALGNGLNGVRMGWYSAENTVGGAAAGERNIISGNGKDGVYLSNPGTEENTVAGNYIGVAADGATAIPNAQHGVEIVAGAANNTIGGTTAGERNIIAGNNRAGVYIEEDDTDGNTVSGNYIGLDATGATALPNGEYGIEIKRGAASNVIGGADAGAGNVISGNSRSGVHIAGEGSEQNWVCGNYIGTDAAGMAAVPNGEHGVMLNYGARLNVVGGLTTSSRNVISGNGEDGVKITGNGTSENVVSGNYVGLDSAGVAALPNGGHGVQIIDGASSNRIGGSTAGERNVLSGNARYGIRISNSETFSTTVQGNYIGVDATGLAALGNSGDGIIVTSGATGTHIGGAAAGEGNVISGNGCLGIGISEPLTRDTVVNGNIIGLDATGTSALSNGCEGIHLGEGASHNTIGGDTAADRNVIAGNHSNGVTITDDGTSDNVVSGNYIGLNAAGTASIGNADAGIRVCNGATDSQILFNVIAGNQSEGVLIQGSGTDDHLVAGNFIGLAADGMTGMPNDVGVKIEAGAQRNTIGGAATSQSNIISSNGDAGIKIEGETTRHNHVIGNVIGADAGGQPQGNGASGIDIMASGNTVGGVEAGEGNIIVANNGAGLTLVGSGAYLCTVQGNYIGVAPDGSVPMGNMYEGIAIQGGAHDNVIGGTLPGAGNVIWHNLDTGVLVRDAGSSENQLSRNSITANGAKGIVTANDGNLELTPPVFTDVEIHLSASSTVTGTACAGCTVEIFTDPVDEGRDFWGSTVADAGGQFAFNGQIAGAYLTATATDTSGNSSEFSAPVAFTPPLVYLPLFQKVH